MVRGRKRACVTYCITYILSCITKHSPQYKVLMIGRVLGGIATSLLFSAFESWLVAEHNKVAAQMLLSMHGDIDTSEMTRFNFNPNQLIVFPMKTPSISYVLDLFCFCLSVHLLPVLST